MDTKKAAQLCYEIGEVIAIDLTRMLKKNLNTEQFKLLHACLGDDAIMFICEGALSYLKESGGLEEFEVGFAKGIIRARSKIQH
jgi:hypothetical protein